MAPADRRGAWVEKKGLGAQAQKTGSGLWISGFRVSDFGVPGVRAGFRAWGIKEFRFMGQASAWGLKP